MPYSSTTNRTNSNNGNKNHNNTESHNMANNLGCQLPITGSQLSVEYGKNTKKYKKIRKICKMCIHQIRIIKNAITRATTFKSAATTIEVTVNAVAQEYIYTLSHTHIQHTHTHTETF